MNQLNMFNYFKKIIKGVINKFSNDLLVEKLLVRHPEEKVEQLLIKKASGGKKKDVEKLAWFYIRSGRIDCAKAALKDYNVVCSRLYAEIALTDDEIFSEMLDQCLQAKKRLSKNEAVVLAKGVKAKNKAKYIEAVLGSGNLDSEENLWRLRAIGEAARRTGDYELALFAYRKAFKLAYQKSNIIMDKGVNKLTKGNIIIKEDLNIDHARKALNEFIKVARPGWFIDAGTLLGFIREGDYLKHDYDIDLGYIDEEAFMETMSYLNSSSLFMLKPGRVKEVFKVRTLNNIDIDVFLYKNENSRFVKESHVYRWEFSPFEVVVKKFPKISLPIPSSPETHLQETYGEWWIPMKGFDGRYDALNVSFPNLNELECVLLNKAVKALSAGRYIDAKKEILMLERIERFPTGLPESSYL